MAVRQAATPYGMQGRVAATTTCAGMGLTPIGSLTGGLLAAEWGLRTGLLVTAAGMMLSPVVMALSPLARLGRQLPVSPGAPQVAARPEARGPAPAALPPVPPPDADPPDRPGTTSPREP